MQKFFTPIALAALVLALSGCGNTWYGVKETPNAPARPRAKALKKPEKKIQEIAK